VARLKGRRVGHRGNKGSRSGTGLRGSKPSKVPGRLWNG
jgi:hypothetical protein